MTAPQRYGITVPVRRHPAARSSASSSASSSTSATPTCGRRSRAATTRSSRSRSPRSGRPSSGSAPRSCPSYTRGAHTLASTVASMCQAAPGRFALGIGTSSNVIVERWNGMAFDKPYQRVRDTIRFLRAALTGEKVDRDVRDVRGERLPARHHRSRAAADPRRRAARRACCGSRAAKATARSSTGSRPTT